MTQRNSSESLAPVSVADEVQDFESWKSAEEYEYQLLKREADTKIKGAVMRANFERLLRIIYIREAHERLEPKRQFSRWCQETGIDPSHAYREMEKIGEFSKEFILSFGETVSFDPNKIARLLRGDIESFSGNRRIAITDGKLVIGDETIEMNPEEVKAIIDARDERIKKLEEQAAQEKTSANKEHAETKKALKKAERELARIKREASRTGMTEEEIAFITSMEEIKDAFEKLITQLDDAGADADQEAITPRMVNAAKLLVAYMKQRLEHLWVTG